MVKFGDGGEEARAERLAETQGGASGPRITRVRARGGR